MASKLGSIVLEPEMFDKAIIGYQDSPEGPRVIYDLGRVLGVYMQDGMSYEEAQEFFEFNTRHLEKMELGPIWRESLEYIAADPRQALELLWETR